MRKLAIIGVGRWGKNLVREFDKISDVAACYYQGNPETVRWLKQNYPNIKRAASYEEILKDGSVRAVVIATPIKTHFDIASRALRAGKHVFLEKPMTDNLGQAKKLVALAKEKNLILFIGHIFLYHPVFKKIKTLTKNDPIQFADFYWSKWGHFTEDIIWNLACHDMAIAIGLLGYPRKISVFNESGGITNGDMVSLKLEFADNKKALMNINRLSPLKRKTITLLTKHGLLVWDSDSLYKLDKKNGSLKLAYQSKTTPFFNASLTIVIPFFNLLNSLVV